jgi:UDP-glucose 4-epimerase
MKILVTGGAGFIASHVADGFVAAGHDVIILDNLSSGVKANINPKAKFVQADVRDAELGKLFADERPEVLCHHAAQMSVRDSVADPVFDAGVNVVGFLNLLEHGRRNGLRKVLFASTGGALYGEQQTFPAAESHPTAPLSPYGIAKLASEHYLFFYNQTYGIDYVALRYANVYGPRQNPHGEAGVVAIFIERLLRGQQPVINGNGTQTRDYVFVRDVVAANLAALTAAYTGSINFGTGIETDVNQIFRTILRVGGFSAPEQHGPEKPGEQRRSVIDNGLAARTLGWRPSVTLEDGLRETVEFFRARAASASSA